MSGRNGTGPDDQAEQLGQLEQLAAPLTLEHGRYRLYEVPAGLMLSRSVDTCDRCQSCGCGTPQLPAQLPDPRRGRAHMIGWLTSSANRELMGAVMRGLQADDD